MNLSLLRWGLVLVLVFLFCRTISLSGKLRVEKADHDLTKVKLLQAESTARNWQAIAGATQKAVQTQSDLALACLRREADAQTAESERAAIVNQIKPRPRSQEERVVDDASRKLAADRLNRPL